MMMRAYDTHAHYIMVMKIVLTHVLCPQHKLSPEKYRTLSPASKALEVERVLRISCAGVAERNFVSPGDRRRRRQIVQRNECIKM